MHDASRSDAAGSYEFLRRDDAAEYVRRTYGFPCSPRWLAKLAVVGDGPIFRKAGRTVLYERDDLDVWARSRIGPKRTSTSEFSLADGVQDCAPASSHDVGGQE